MTKLNIQINGTLTLDKAMEVAARLHRFTLSADPQGGPPPPFLDVPGVFAESIELKVSPIEPPNMLHGVLNLVVTTLKNPA